MTRPISSLLPYFGAARMVAPRVGELLAGCDYVAVPFMGGGSELYHIRARTMVVSDLNRFAINLANVLGHPAMGPALIRDLRRALFHGDELRHAQELCRAFAEAVTDGWQMNYECARAYFVCCWMTRSGSAGTGSEFTGSLSLRWKGGGGDSAVRFRSATESLREWRRVARRCTFEVMDCFEMLDRVKDNAGTGVYCDPPWFDDGDSYTHTFTDQQHRDLAAKLATYEKARVVVRFGDHLMVRELYPESRWQWHEVNGRTQHNAAKAEVLLVNRGEG